MPCLNATMPSLHGLYKDDMERLSRNYGFSLVELVVIILILGIISTTLYFKWSDSPFNLYSQAAMLANDIRYTQNLSISKNQRFRLVKTSTNTYQIQNSAGTPIIKPMDKSATVTLSSGVTFGTLTGITSKIIFNAQGIPYSDNPETPLTQTAVISLTSGGTTTTVAIYPETGRVTP